MLNVKNLKEEQLKGNPTLNLMIYGDSGVGKTTLAATAAELGKVLYIDAEAGANFIDNRLAENIDILKLEDIFTLDEVLKKANVEKYNTIVLDSVTEIMKKMIDKIKGTKDQATMQDWSKIISKMEKYFRDFRDVEKNIILVALTNEKEDEGIILKRPSLSGKNLPADTMGFMDICIYLENTIQGRVGYIQPTQKFYAKDRTNKLPAKIEQKDLNIKFIVEKVLSKPELATNAQKAEIDLGIKELKMTAVDIKKMLAFGGAKTAAELNTIGADKIIKAINLKINKSKDEIK